MPPDSMTPDSLIDMGDDDLETVLAELDSGAVPAGIEDIEKPPGKRRGRKPGAANRTMQERLARAIALAEKARQEAAALKRAAEMRTALIVGRAMLALADANSAVRAQLLEHLRAADLSPKDRAEIAHLFVTGPEAAESEAAE